MNTPRTLEELKRRLHLAQASGSEIKIGQRALAALSQLMDQPEEVAVASISSLAERTGVNASTLSRLVRKLGFAHFAEFQLLFRKQMARRDRTRFYSDLAGQFLSDQPQQEAEPARSPQLVMGQLAQEESQNIAQMLQHLDAQVVEQTVALLIRAPRVRVYGLRQAHAMANYLTYALGMLRDDVSLLGHPHHGIAHGLTEMEAEDVLVVIGAAPYTRATIAAARMAANHQVQVIALTDSHGSPLAAEANYTFIAPTSGSWYSNSMAAFLVLIEGLMALVASQLGRSALLRLKRHEALIDELNHEL